MDMKNFQEKEVKATSSESGTTTAVPKKTDHPLLFFFGLAILGFCLTAALFAFFSKPNTNLTPRKNISKIVPNESKPMPQEVAPISAKETPASKSGVVPEKPPIVSAPEQDASPVSLILSGIVFGPNGGSLALINGKVVSEGALVEGAKVEKISSDTVELSLREKKIVLRSR